MITIPWPFPTLVKLFRTSCPRILASWRIWSIWICTPISKLKKNFIPSIRIRVRCYESVVLIRIHWIWIRIHWILIQIQHFKWIRIRIRICFRIRSFDDQKLEKKYLRNSKIAIYLSLGLLKGSLSYKEPSKENILDIKKLNLLTVFYFCVSFFPSWIRIQSG